MSLLPNSSTTFEQRLENARLIDLDPDVILKLWNPWTCPLHLLPQLAWALSVDEWNDNWDEATQRQVVANSVQIHRLKGTVGAVERAMESLGHETRLIEWWQMQPPGEPHTFTAEIDIDDRGMSESLLSSLERQINRAKPVRSHYQLRLVAEASLSIHVGCMVVTTETIESYPLMVTEIYPEPAYLKTSMVAQAWETITLYPKAAP
ncbi:phage tail protein I [Pseudomonas sp. 21LCFQ010]|uniref:phage tail protein I n=1 Tax=Pseudomonas sp. 21LCFQ010 TaxID=2957506 RepID=UPI002097AF5C|nr:phage tail protein I [Pseudomonas sp. 21LCFQ010]MCO8161989.1 phage tail protein I [Pseudomonas sp. 21LCFQ010]